jgi:hypothetical protein
MRCRHRRHQTDRSYGARARRRRTFGRLLATDGGRQDSPRFIFAGLHRCEPVSPVSKRPSARVASPGPGRGGRIIAVMFSHHRKVTWRAEVRRPYFTAEHPEHEDTCSNRGSGDSSQMHLLTVPARYHSRDFVRRRDRACGVFPRASTSRSAPAQLSRTRIRRSSCLLVVRHFLAPQC